MSTYEGLSLILSVAMLVVTVMMYRNSNKGTKK